MKAQSYNKLKHIVSDFRNKKVLVIGDLILDEFIWGDVSRISPEAPVPVVWVKNESFMPGGASNVANNLRSLGSTAYISGVVGNDRRSAILLGELERRGIITDGVIKDSSRPTILKTRVIAHQQQVVRIDREKTDSLPEKLVKRIVNYLDKVIDEIDAVIIEDYGKGVVNPKLLSKINTIIKRKKKVLAIDPKEENFSYYRGATLITPNRDEAARAVGFKLKDHKSLRKAGQILLQKLKVKVALLTLGEEGMMVFEVGKAPKKIPTIAQEVFDVSGAGDTVVATSTLSLISGASALQAAHIANCAAGTVVGKIGIAVVTQDELIKRIREEIEKGR